jgi:hypothetical protein
MLEGAKKHFYEQRWLPPDSWSETDKTNWYYAMAEATETLSRALAVLRPNIREVRLPRSIADEPGSSSRRWEYSESLKCTAELIYGILESAGRECGQEFQEKLKRWVTKQFRRKDVRHWTRPDKKVNLEMIRILRETSTRCTSHPKELKDLAPPDRQDPDRWAHDVGVQLKRFCVRAHRVWQELRKVPRRRRPLSLEQSSQVGTPNARRSDHTRPSQATRRARFLRLTPELASRTVSLHSAS